MRILTDRQFREAIDKAVYDATFRSWIEQKFQELESKLFELEDEITRLKETAEREEE